MGATVTCYLDGSAPGGRATFFSYKCKWFVYLWFCGNFLA